MTNTISMARNQNLDNDASSSRKMSKTCAHWSDLDHDLLFLVMMQLGVVDFLSFGGVCKSWRLLAVSNMNLFMASKPPMPLHIFSCAYKKVCYLEDFEGRKFKTILPTFAVGACVGITCGYLTFFTLTTRNFWLVNLVTRHELHFPDFPTNYRPGTFGGRAILVFSPSLSTWVFVVLCRDTRTIWFSIAGKGAWNHLSYTFPIVDLCPFKGKIYTLSSSTRYLLCELRLNPEPKLMLLETKKFSWPGFRSSEFVSLDENLCVMGRTPGRLLELDFGEMKWVPSEKTPGKYAFFLSDLNRSVAVKRESWAQYGRHGDADKSGKNEFYAPEFWYFPHECLNVDQLDH